MFRKIRFLIMDSRDTIALCIPIIIFSIKELQIV